MTNSVIIVDGGSVCTLGDGNTVNIHGSEQYKTLMEELLQLKKEIERLRNYDNRYKDMHKIDKAYTAAKKGNMQKVVNALKEVGDQVLTIATSISADLVAEIIKKAVL